MNYQHLEQAVYPRLLALSREMGIQLLRRYWQPLRWYLLPVLVMYTVTDCGSETAGVLAPLEELLGLLAVDAVEVVVLTDAFPSENPFEYPELYPAVFPSLYPSDFPSAYPSEYPSS